MAYPDSLFAANDGHCALLAGDILCWGDADRSITAQGVDDGGLIGPTGIIGF